MKTGDFDKYVDSILKVHLAGNEIKMFDVIDTAVPELKDKFEKKIFIDFLIENNLIKTTGDKLNDILYSSITPKGYGIYVAGGWKKHLKFEEDKKQLEIDLVKSSIRTNRQQKWLLWFTTGFTLVTLVITCSDYKLHQQELQLQLQPRHQKEESGQPSQQSTETVDPTQDSSKILKNDSLDSKLKVTQ